MSQYQRLLLVINPAMRLSTAISQATALAKASGAARRYTSSRASSH